MMMTTLEFCLALLLFQDFFICSSFMVSSVSMVSSLPKWFLHGFHGSVTEVPPSFHQGLYGFITVCMISYYIICYSASLLPWSHQEEVSIVSLGPHGAITAPLFHCEDISMVYHRDASIVSFRRRFYSLSQRRLDSFIMFQRFHCGEASLASLQRCLYGFITETSPWCIRKMPPWFHHSLHGFITASMISLQSHLHGFITETPQWFHHGDASMVSSLSKKWFHYRFYGFIMVSMASSWKPLHSFITVSMITSWPPQFHHSLYGFFTIYNRWFLKSLYGVIMASMI